MSKLVILYGGAFDPPHVGHIATAQKAITTRIAGYTLADELWFLPCYSDAFGKKKLSPAEDRVLMLERVVAENPAFRFRVCTDEIEMRNRAGTYAVVREMYRRYPGYEFLYLIGLDQARDIRFWRNSRKLRKVIRFMAVKRKGVFPYGTAGWVNQSPHMLIKDEPLKTNEDISSSRIRAAFRSSYKTGEPIPGLFLSWLTPLVNRHILENKLYMPEKEQSA